MSDDPIEEPAEGDEDAPEEDAHEEDAHEDAHENAPDEDSPDEDAHDEDAHEHAHEHAHENAHEDAHENAPDEDSPDEHAHEDAAPEHAHDPIPETLDDPTPPRRRRWWLLLVALVAVLAGGGAWIYFNVLRYEPTALWHVPKGANIVIRAEAEPFFTYGPVKKHLWPLLFTRKGDENARLASIAKHTGVDLRTDLRELVVASVDGTAWVAIAGGNVEPGRFVDGLHTALQEDGVPGFSRDGALLVHTVGATFAQADDGSLIVGSHREIVEAAIHRADQLEDHIQRLGNTEDDAGLRLWVSHLAFKNALRAIPKSFPAEPLRAIDEISGVVHLTDAPTLTLELTPKSTTTPDKLAASISALFSKLGLVLLLVPQNLYGAKSAISSVDVSAGPDEVVLHTSWPYQPIDDGLKLLAEQLGKAKAPDR